MAGRFSMGGDWAGHYVSHYTERPEGPVFGVTARLVEVAGAFNGTMVDLEPSYEVPLNSYLLRMELEDQRRARAYLESFKNITVRMTLPQRARIDGRWNNGSIEFVKRYEGAQTIEWLSEGKVITIQKVENHCVHYQGRLNPQGDVLDGKWRVRAQGLAGLFGKTNGEGTFHLVRQSS